MASSKMVSATVHQLAYNNAIYLQLHTLSGSLLLLQESQDRLNTCPSDEAGKVPEAVSIVHE